jgi:hypothetical protein
VKSCFILAAAALLGFCLASPQLFPFLEYLREGAASHFRGGFGWKTYPWFSLLTWAMPRFFGDPRAGNFWGFSSFLGEAVYIGMAPLLFAAVGLILAPKRRYHWGVLSIAAFGMLGLYAAPVQELLKRVPFLSHLDNNKLPALVVFGAIFFAVAGFDHFLRVMAGQTSRTALTWNCAAAFWIGLVFVAACFFRDAIRELKLAGFLLREAWFQLGLLLLVSAIVGSGVARRLRPASAAWLLLAITAGDLLRLTWYYYPSATTGSSLPRSASVEYLRRNSGKSRFLGLAGWVPPEISILYGIEDVRGIDGHTPFRIYQVLGRIDPAIHDLRARLQAGVPPPGKWTQSTLFFKSIEPVVKSADPEIIAALQQLDYWSYDISKIENPGLLSVLGVRYVIGPKGDSAPAAAGLALVHSSDADVWENRSCLPRAFVSTRLDFVQSESEALDAIAAPGFVERNTAVIQLGGDPPPRLQSRTRRPALIPARIDRYAPESVLISAEAPEGGWLVLSDLYYPGWEATVDGVAVPVYQANYLFRAVELPPGRHQVRFAFRPASLRAGVLTCLLALAVLAATRVWQPRGRKHDGRV